ncbi:MAG: ATP-binding cassette domain-containing protein [Peptococcaceae bacterium]|nr:ATP-binding cassette domain-containing protein [Peptococcaceae bacterium]
MIELRQVSLTYNHNYLFRGLDFTINSGAKILLNAASGTGKTSFFRLLLGFIQPIEGEVLYDGIKLSAETVKQIRRKIGYLSQDIDMPWGKVGEVVNQIFCYRYNKSLHADHQKLFELIDFLELGKDVLEKNVEELSGGERQRLLLIILLLLDREVYLLDEPTSALDENLKMKVRDLFLSHSATVLVISHDKVWIDSKNLTVLNWTENAGWKDGQ